MKKLLFALLPMLLVVAMTSCEKDSDTPPPPIGNETQKVDNVDGVNEILKGLVASPDNKPVDVTVTKPVTSPETITIPHEMVLATAPSLSFSFEQHATAKVTVTDAATTDDMLYKGVVSVALPQGTDVEINMPGATVYLNGTKVANVSSTTAQNTFVVAADTKISSVLTVAKGSVNIFGEVNAIERSQDNPDATTIVNLFAGAKLTTTPTDEKIIVKNVLVGIHNATKDKYYESVKEAVLDASAEDVIELSAGAYPLTVDAQKQATNQDWYLNIDKKITIKGVDKGVILYGVSPEGLFNGSAAKQRLVNIQSDGVVLDNLTFMVHKLLEKSGSTKVVAHTVIGLGYNKHIDGFTMKNCSITPNTKVEGAIATDAGFVWLSDADNVVIEKCVFDRSAIKIENSSAKSVAIKGSTFTGVITGGFGWFPGSSKISDGHVGANSSGTGAVVTISDNNFVDSKIEAQAENVVIRAVKGKFTLTNNTFPTTDTYWQALNEGKITLNGTLLPTNYIVSDWFNSRTEPDVSEGKSVKGSNFVTVVTRGSNVQNGSAWQGYSTHTSAPLQTTWSVSADLTLTAAEIGGDVAITMWTDIHPNGFKASAPHGQGIWPVMGYVNNGKQVGWGEFNFEESTIWQSQWTILNDKVVAGTYRLKMECVGGNTINYYVNGGKIGTRTLTFDTSYTDEPVVSSLPYELVFTSRDYTSVPYTSKWTNIVVN